jgi:NAD(P)-dependent dehydrogenase (short-subunit alcohol dehydrogenase family)
MSTQVLITGAYGRAGTELAQALARQEAEFDLTLCGRNREKLCALAGALPQSSRVHTRVAGLGQAAALAEGMAPGAVWINCAPWPDSGYDDLARGIVRAGVVYLDIQPSSDKFEAFDEAFTRNPDSPARIALEAGISPGAQALVAGALSQGLERIDELTLDVAMRDDAIPDAGLTDILAHLTQPAMLWRGGRWRRALVTALRSRRAAPGFTGMAAPAWMPELDEFARNHQPGHLHCYYIAPSGPVGLILALGYVTGLVRFAVGRRWLLPLLRWAFARLRPPFGFALRGSVRGEANGEAVRRCMTLQFDDLYEATVTPVVAATQMLAEGIVPRQQLACFGNQFEGRALVDRLPRGEVRVEEEQ